MKGKQGLIGILHGSADPACRYTVDTSGAALVNRGRVTVGDVSFAARWLYETKIFEQPDCLPTT